MGFAVRGTNTGVHTAYASWPSVREARWIRFDDETMTEPAPQISPQESASTNQGPLRDGASARGAIAGFLVAAAVLVALTRYLAHYVDDAFITFRYARNWADWGLPVFNSFELAESAERVEGYSNFLWMGLLGLLHGLGANLEKVTLLLQLGIGILTLGAVARGCSRQLGLGLVGSLAAPLLLATAAPFASWSSGGMETGLFTLLLTLMFFGCLRSSGDGRGVWLGLLGAAVVLVRVEGIAWVLGTFGAAAAAQTLLRRSPGTARRYLVALAIAFAALAAQLVFRKLVYGELISNTVTAKTGGAGAEVYARGLRQVASWCLVTLTPIFALLAMPLALRHARLEARTAALAALFTVLGFVGYNVATGGDWMPYFRFLAPAAPLLACSIAIGLDKLPRTPALVFGLGFVVLQPLTLFEIHVAPQATREALRFRSFKGGYRTEMARIETARVNAGYFGQLGAALDLGTEEGDVLAFGAIGSPGWHAPKLDFVDRNGLVTPVVARREVARGEGTAGHEKRVPHAFFLDSGDPAPKWMFAKLFPVSSPPLGQAKDAIRGDGVVGRKPERELFERTVLRMVPITEGAAAGQTLMLLERATPEAASAFWGQGR